MPGADDLRRQLGTPSPSPRPSPGGAGLVARLRAAATEVSGLVIQLSGVRPGPPIRSQDRRRVADQAERSAATLAAICQELDVWMVERAQGQDRIAAPLVAEAGNAAESPVVGRDVPGAPLVEVSNAQEALDRARADLQQTVEAARSRGASWRQIGRALGIAGQTAHKRFDPRARQRHADSMRQRYRRLNSH